ncbi:MAG: transposase [Acidimicrobiales bacterium]
MGTQVTNWHRSGLSNGRTEAINNLNKRIGFGFRRFRNYGIRARLYAGRTQLGAIRQPHPRQNPMSP